MLFDNSLFFITRGAELIHCCNMASWRTALEEKGTDRAFNYVPNVSLSPERPRRILAVFSS